MKYLRFFHPHLLIEKVVKGFTSSQAADEFIFHISIEAAVLLDSAFEHLHHQHRMQCTLTRTQAIQRNTLVHAALHEILSASSAGMQATIKSVTNPLIQQ